jgi:hypothetical protein
MSFANLNRRHKAILLLTLIATGLVLLNGIAIGEGLGIALLGVAAAWIVGSNGFYKPLVRIIIDCLDALSPLLYVSFVKAGLILILVGLLAVNGQDPASAEALYWGVLVLAIAFLIYRKYGSPRSWRHSKKN